jgi:NADH dehydrogenase
MKVLVTGAHDLVVHGVHEALRRRGHQVHALDEMASPSSLREACRGAGAVVHMALWRRDLRTRTVRTQALADTRALLAAVRDAAVPFFVHCSPVGADRSAHPALRPYRHAEMLVRERSAPWMVLRLAPVYGPRLGLVGTLVERVRRRQLVGTLAPMGASLQPLWVDDCAELVARAVERPDLARRSIDVAGPETWRIRDVLACADQLLRRTSRPVEWPAWMMRLSHLAARIEPVLALDASVSRSEMVLVREGHGVRDPRHQALQQLFGLDGVMPGDGVARCLALR